MALKSSLKRLERLIGRGKIVTDEAVVRLYARNPLGLQSTAGAVVFPESVEDLSRVAAWAYGEEVPLYPEGSSTELTGSSIPEPEGVVVSFQRMDRIREISIVDGYVTAEAGVRLAELNAAVEREGYMFPVDPASWRVATVGGAVNTGAGGMRGAKYGTMREWVSRLKVVLPDERGTVLTIGCLTVKCRQGYDLVRLIVGSEGTLALVAEATLRIVPIPENIVTMLAFFPDLESLMEAVVELKRARISPYIMEFMDSKTVAIASESLGRKPPAEGDALIVSVDVPPEAAGRYAALLEEAARRAGALKVLTAKSTRETEEAGLMELRRRFFPASLEYARRRAGRPGARLVVLIEDIAVPPSRLPEAVRLIRQAAEERGLEIVIGGHVGDGNLHPKTWFDPSDREWASRVEEWFREVMRIAVELGGTISAEHGIGKLKKWGLAMELERLGSTKALELMAEIKRVFDPKGILNPGKMI